MNKKSLYLILTLVLVHASYAQTIFKSANGKIRFFSYASVENIEATNKDVISLIDISTGDVFVKTTITKFVFNNALMQEHFNEKYLESEKYPTSTFKGKIQNFNSLNLKKDTTCKVLVDGILTLHGVAKNRTIECTLSKKGNQISVDSKFIVALADHTIEIPRLLFEKIAEKIEIFFTAVHLPNK